ncbi:hypothetical protein RSOL_213110 [Rhizoctonia solani AG-3 Rhs1AP]|uniref:F-box domain-containing protein n=1 Tax=Rhizoctonia solani AG-3 Rhs1AP TaxID=1086054 RepID=X8J5C5_9AGAM|nr:hypothetical protein RSOL_213110 [Rhizoctonia solani AG-3 Rhs1AP]
MVDFQGGEIVRETKKKKKGLVSLLLQYKAILSESKTRFSDVFRNKRQRGRTNRAVEQADSSPTTCGDAFMRVPVEVFIEIASHLLPVDVISLSRCNKLLWNLLMNQSSRHIWTSAIVNVEGLPPCPPDMNEPYYVRLLFLPCCTICGEGSDCNIYLRLRLRLCRTCRSKYLVTIHDIQDIDEQSQCFSRARGTSA